MGGLAGSANRKRMPRVFSVLFLIYLFYGGDFLYYQFLHFFSFFFFFFGGGGGRGTFLVLAIVLS